MIISDGGFEQAANPLERSQKESTGELENGQLLSNLFKI